jgi:predicted nucleic acid-binding protein
MYRLHWSEAILEEVRRNLVKRGMTNSLEAQDLIDVMSEFFAEALVRSSEMLVPCMTNDEKDRHVLAVAVMSRSQVIVTSNNQDFPDTALDPFGVVAQTPDEFLTHLFDLNPKRMAKILTEQSQDLDSPPMSVQEVLVELALHAPGFVNLISSAFPK